MKVIFTRLACALLVMATAVAAHAGDLEKPSALSFEGMGRGLLYSVNYDRALSNRIAVGVGYSSFSAGFVDVSVLPVYLNYYFYNSDLKSHRWFATGGVDVVTASINFWGLSVGGTGAIPTFGTGYEYRSSGGFLVRAAVYGLVADTVDIFPGVSIGCTF